MRLPTRGKYNTAVAKKDKPTLDGYVFDSGAEVRRYNDLKLRQRAGEITDLEPRPKAYKFIIGGVLVTSYRPDFTYKDLQGNLVVEDVKSGPTRTRDYIIRKKLMKAVFGITVSEVMY